MIAIDGNKHAGLATAYLIDRAPKSRGDELVVVTVEPTQTAPTQPASPLSELTTSHSLPPHAIADGAGPWLDSAGIEYEFRNEVGEIADVVAGLTGSGGFHEIVLVSDAPRPLARLLNRFRWYRRGMAFHRLRAATRLPISLVTGRSPAQTSSTS